MTSKRSFSGNVSAFRWQSTPSPPLVVFNPSPSTIFTGSGVTSFCNGGSTTLNTSTGTGYSYQWYRNATLIPSATNSSYTATTSGNYTVVTTLGTCSRTSTGTNVTVWPNPVVTVAPAVSTIQKYYTQTLTGSGAANYNWAAQPTYISSTTNSIVLIPLNTSNHVI